MSGMPRLTRPVEPEEMDHCFSRQAVVVATRAKRLARMRLQDVVLNRVASVIEHDAVDAGRIKHVEVGRTNLIRLDQPQVELNARWQQRVARQHCERLAILSTRHPHRTKFFGEVDRLGPRGELPLDASVGVSVVGQQLQARSGADHIVGQRQHDASGVAVIATS